MEGLWSLLISFGIGFLVALFLFSEYSSEPLNWLNVAIVTVILGLIIRLFPRILEFVGDIF